MSRTLVTTSEISPLSSKAGVEEMRAWQPVRKTCSRVTGARWARASKVPDLLMMPSRSRSHMDRPTTSSARRPVMSS